MQSVKKSKQNSDDIKPLSGSQRTWSLCSKNFHSFDYTTINSSVASEIASLKTLLLFVRSLCVLVAV